jgi:hypothetical protein
MKVSCGVVVVAAMVLAGCCGAAGATASAALQQSASTVGQHDRLELTVRITAAYEDPFDPEQIDLRAVFTTPSGQSIRVPGFYYQPYGRSQDEDRQEVLTPAGSSVFKVRFAWGEVGEYRFEAVARDSGGEQVLGRGAFQVVSSDARGYVRRSSSSPLYFEFDSGDSYFPIGENMCWPKDRGTYDYDEWMPKLAASGGDYIRLWLINEWNELGLEHLELSAGDGNGLGQYDQQAAWRIDYILDLAEKLGFEVLMCIESLNSLSTGPHPLWERYP